MSTVEFRLRRPTADTPWGFRLHGGLDVNAPLSVQRVFNGSPADGNLQRGDVLLSINNNDVSAAFLKKAEELVKASSNILAIAVRRTGQPVNSSQPFNDLPSQQPVHRPAPTHQQPQPVAPSLSQHQPPGGRQSQQANVWRPPPVAAQSADRFDNNHTVASSSYQPVKNQWAAESTGAQSADQYHQRQDDQLFPPFSAVKTETSVRPANQNYVKQNASSSHVAAPHSTVQVQVQQQQQQQQQQADNDEEDYEPKSVRDIKQMFNKPSKPLSFVPGQKQASNRPQQLWRESSSSEPAPVADLSTSWNTLPQHHAAPSMKPVSQTTSLTRSFTSPAKSSPSSYYDDIYGDYPPPRQDLTPIAQPSRLPMVIKPQPKPGAGYSYQGIVTVTPAKTVHSKGKSSGGGGGGGGGGSGAAKKKEFDPSQSLVYQMLQEENERKKRGEVASPDEEAPRRPPQQQQQQQGPSRGAQRGSAPQPRQGQSQQQQSQQRSARLQELLERDQAQAQQHNDDDDDSRHMTAMARREMSPSYPHHHPHQQQQQQIQQQQAPPPRQRQQQQPSYHAETNYQQQQQYYQQQQQQPSYGHQQQYPASQHGGYQSYGNNIPVSDF